jgi:hypothetical protein
VSFSSQDSLRANPFLARYTLTPRLPLDPADHIPAPATILNAQDAAGAAYY